jgi:hypothetical protein
MSLTNGFNLYLFNHQDVVAVTFAEIRHVLLEISSAAITTH